MNTCCLATAAVSRRPAARCRCSRELVREVAFSADYVGLPLDRAAAVAVLAVTAVIGPLAVLLDQPTEVVAGCATAAVLAVLYLFSRRGRWSPRHARRRGGSRTASFPGTAAAAALRLRGGGGPSPLS